MFLYNENNEKYVPFHCKVVAVGLITCSYVSLNL